MSDQPPSTGKLAYRDWRDDAPGRRRYAIQLALGFVCGALAVFISGCDLFMANLHYNPRPLATYETDHFDWREPATVTAIVLALLAGGMLWARKRGNRAFVAGAFLGIGVMGLIDGMCFWGRWI